jgi:DNA polymerase-3 subunit alpha
MPLKPSMSVNHTLSCRSDHSIGESIMQVGTIVDAAKALGYKSLGIVDSMSISSLVEFSSKCKKADIKPIIGCTIRVYEDPSYRKPTKASGDKEKKNPFYQLKVYVKSDTGLRSLMKLLTKGNSEEYFYYHSRVGIAEVLELEDVVVTTGDIFNVFHANDHANIVKSLVTKFGIDNVFVEVTPISTPLFDTLNTYALKTAAELGIPIVAAYPCFYKEEHEAGSLDVLRAITSNQTMDSRSLPIPFVRDMCFISPTELAGKLVSASKRIDGFTADIVKASLLNINKIAEACNYEFKKLEPSLPAMTENDFLELVSQCKQGWVKRFDEEVMGHKPDELTVYKERLSYELGVIKGLGFSTYFLVVQNIVVWSKENGINVGPGRGSAGGSLISYLMGITDVDPIRFDLLILTVPTYPISTWTL